MTPDIVKHRTGIANVLLVEDNPHDVELIRRAIRKKGLSMSIDVVDDGVKAMQYLRRLEPYEMKTRPDLVILDLNLPLKSGHEVLAEIREDEALTALPVVILTTSTNEDDISASYKNHANCYIAKPMDLTQLGDVVSKLEEFWFSIVKLPEKTGS